MLGDTYTIWFLTDLDNSGVTISLTAQVEPDAKRKQYRIKNIRHARSLSGNLLPDMLLEKVKNEWVYSDSRRGNEPTLVIGQAIDEHQATVMSKQQQ